MKRARASDVEPSLVALADELRRRMAENPNVRHWYPNYRQLFDPFEDVPSRLRNGDETAIEPALRFLEADPWCFRSGYLKASLMRALAGGVPLTGYQRRVHRVLLARLRSPQPGLRKPAMTLAASVWDSSLDDLLTELSRKGDAEFRDRVIDFRTGVAHRLVQRESAAKRAANPGPTS